MNKYIMFCYKLINIANSRFRNTFIKYEISEVAGQTL